MSTKIKTINYTELVDALLGTLPQREREVLQKRNALVGLNEATLEQIGSEYNITRERVRQIEKEGLKKLLSTDIVKTKIPINDLQAQIEKYLQTSGGLMAENHLKDKLLVEQLASEEKALNFLLGYILGSKFNRVDDKDDFHVIWHLNDVDLEQSLEIAQALKEIIASQEMPMHLDDLHEQFQTHNLYPKIDQAPGDNQAIIEALLRVRRDLDKNILGQWGSVEWNTVKPKRMADKAYLILMREGKPLHFTEVANLINQANFDHKKACPATVHNELILDDKYILVGRGIYALRDWGYQEGTVADIIEKILKEKGALTKKDLMDEVLKQRIVQRTTVTLALMNKDRFNRQKDGLYSAI